MKHLLLSLAVIAGLAGATQASAADLYGRWKNPKNSVHVDIRPCGESACGYVVWASEKAQEDARRGSGKELVGMQLLRDFKPSGKGWRGKVFVPDLNRTFSGAARLKDDEHMEAKGCLVAGVLCKEQVWTRLTSAD